jgi:hypothetical protein
MPPTLGLYPMCFFWQIFTKVQPEKCDFDQYKGFFMGKMVQILQILENEKIQIVIFLQ